MESAYIPTRWATFFSAEAGASAALAGLIFVAVSINLEKIVGSTMLVARAAKALVTLVGVLIAATLGMVPGQPERALGWELAGLGVLMWLATTRAQHAASHKNPYVSRWQRKMHFAMTQAASLPFVVAGGSLAALRGGGLYWLAGGVIFAFVAALLDAWVLLVEIHR